MRRQGDFLDGGLAAVKSEMNLTVEVTTDDAAARDDQHRDRCHGAVDRHHSEIRMEKDYCGTDHAENHVGAKPKRH
jgi:hypothetical protein